MKIYIITTFIGYFCLSLMVGCKRTTSYPLEPIPAIGVSPDALPVVIDTDMAADDWLAILYLLMRPDIDVLAITVTGAGEAHCDPGTRNALGLVTLAGRPDIPISCGRETPLRGQHSFPGEWRRQVDNLLGLSLPESPKSVANEQGVDLLTRVIRESPRKVHLLALGPLTNVAEALIADPALVDDLEMITIMGGAVRVPGNVGPSSQIENEYAEWNIYVDPYAAGMVFNSGAPITLVPLDATNDVPLTLDFYRRLEKDRANSVAEFVYQVLAAQEEAVRSGWSYFWDPLAAGVVTETGLVTFQEMPLMVVADEGPASGRTLEHSSGPSVRVAMSADQERFERLFLETINGRSP